MAIKHEQRYVLHYRRNCIEKNHSVDNTRMTVMGCVNRLKCFTQFIYNICIIMSSDIAHNQNGLLKHENCVVPLARMHVEYS